MKINDTDVRVDFGKAENGAPYIQFVVPNDNRKTSPIPLRTAVTDNAALFGALADISLPVFSTSIRNEVKDEINEAVGHPSNFLVATKTGFLGEAFVWGNDVIYPEADERSLRVEIEASPKVASMLRKYVCSGSLKSWKNTIGTWAVGNNLLTLSVAMAFAGPTAAIGELRGSGGLQIVGPGETGKTGLLHAAGSVHGRNPNGSVGFCETWRTTSGAAGLLGPAHSQTFLGLDETRHAGDGDPVKAAKLIYDFAFALHDGKSKVRLTDERPPEASQLFFLSTSNASVAEVMREGGAIYDKALASRLTDVPCRGRFGVFDDLHGFSDGAALTDAIKDASDKFYGVAGRTFIQRLINELADEPKEIRKLIQGYIDEFRTHVSEAANRRSITPLNRTINRVGAAYAGARLAIKWNILPWERKELSAALTASLVAGLRFVSEHLTDAERVFETPKARLVRFITENKSKFIDLDKTAPEFGPEGFASALGFKKTFRGERQFYLTSDRLRSLLGSSDRVKALIAELVNEHLHPKPPSGSLLLQRSIFEGHAPSRVHPISRAILKKVEP
jgi:putative DNA primase/helicase